MSQSVAILTKFKNVELLLEVFRSNRWQIQENCKSRTYPTDSHRDDIHRYVAVNPTGKFDIGINADQEGNYSFTCDFYDHSIESQLGKNLSMVKQGYAFGELRTFMAEEDMTYKIERLNSGEMKITAND